MKNTSMSYLVSRKYISEDKCLKTGGHCFVSTGEFLASNPPQYPEVCKHCGVRRVGIPQEPMRYI